MAFTPDGSVLATAQYEVRFWDVRSGQELAALTKQVKGGAPVAFSPNGKFMATGDLDGNATLWSFTRSK